MKFLTSTLYLIFSRLTGKVEHLEADLKNVEERASAANSQLETQTILCKDREKQVHQLQEEVGQGSHKVGAVGVIAPTTIF